MLHYVHQLVANIICLLFGAEQVVYSGFLDRFSLKQRYKSGETDLKQLCCGTF